MMKSELVRKRGERLIPIAVLAFLAGLLLFSAVPRSEASGTVPNEKVVISVCVREGDTLWSIASQYYTDDYENVEQMIRAIQECNGISDQIHIGQRILIPCYLSAS